LLGCSREEIELALGCRSVPVDKGDGQPSAVFNDIIVHAHFDASGRCEAVEVMPPAQPMLAGISLLVDSYPSVRRWMERHDPGLIVETDGATSQKFGVGLYAPLAAEFPDRPAEGVIAFVRGYYCD
jgi:hypothetical protein